MEYKKLNGTNVKISQLVFGAYPIGGWFWGGSNEKDAIEAMDAAIDNGVTTIDTAPVYGMGHSESIVGKVIQGKREEVKILTKFGMRWDITKGVLAFDSYDNDGNPIQIYKFNGKESIIEECERSLKRLRTDYIDLYQMHWPENTTPIEETMEALQILLDQGKIRAAGVCNCPVDLLDRARKVAHVATNQVAYCMVDRSIEEELVPYCVKEDVGILSHTTLQKGLLTGKIKPGHQFNKGDNRPNTRFFKPGNHEQVMKMLDEIGEIANERKITLAQLAINWTMQQPAVTGVLVGARNKTQLLDNVKAASFNLTAEELDKIDNAYSKLNCKEIMV